MFRKIFAVACWIALAATSTGAAAQTVVTSASTLSAAGSYILNSNVVTITISGSNITVDLNGFGIRGSVVTTCSVTAGTAGNSCSGALSGTDALTITGNNVTIKNGQIFSGANRGVVISSSARQDVTLQNVKINSFKGDCIVSSSSGLTLDNVTVTACGGNGVLAQQDEAIFRNVVASNNNGSGIDALGSAIFENVHANWNKSIGIAADPGTAVRASVANNLSTGIGQMGVLKDSLSFGNGLYGVYAPFASLVRDTYSRNNTSSDFNLSPDTCYFALVADSASSIVSGVPLVGSTAACF